jgi:PAS domain S-box-containing protein
MQKKPRGKKTTRTKPQTAKSRSGSRSRNATSHLGTSAGTAPPHLTEQKYLQEKLAASEKYFRTLIENSSDGIALINEKGDITYTSPAIIRILGYEVDEYVGNNAFSFMHPDDLPAAEDLFRKLLEKPHASVLAHIRERHKDGSWRWLEGHAVNLLNDPGIQAIVVNFRDITERKLADEELHKSEEQYRLLFENNPHPMWVYDAHTFAFLAVNDAAVSHYGYTREEFLNMTIREIRPLEEQKQLEESLRTQVASRQRSGPWIHQKKDGTIIYVEIISHDIVFLGKAARLVLANDITERRRAERELLDSEERFRQLADNIEEVFWITEPETKRDIYISPAGEKVWGLTLENIDEFMKTILPEDRPAVEAALERQRQGQKTEMEYRIQHADGSTHWIWDRAFPIFDGEGRLVRVAGIAADITERKQIQDVLREREEKMQKLFTILPVGVSIVDQQRHIHETNPALEKILRLSKEALLTGEYAAHQRYINKENQPIPENELPSQRAIREQREILDVEIGVINDRNEPAIWTQVSAAPIPDVGAVVVTADISERKRAEEMIRKHASELEQRVEERTADLQRANRAKDEFLANMSHELRTPLNGILGFSEALLDGVRGPLNERQSEAIEVIASSGHHLLGLINDILDVSKIEAGRLDFHPELIDTSEICEASLMLAREMAAKKSIDLKFDPLSDRSMFFVDPQRMKQILVNLLSNSIKFTQEHGKVTLNVHTDTQKNQIEFHITDTGIGIGPADLEKLFNPFFQVDSSLTRQKDGSGLGLALVHKLVKMHSGRVEVESQLEKGSTFTVILPWSQNMDIDQKTDLGSSSLSQSRPSNTEDPASSKTPAGQRGTILMAEDKETNVMVVKDYLEYRGYQVVIAYNGVEALAKAEQVLPDVILMDVQMPEMDGLEAIRRLRANPRFSEIPIIAITALAMPGDRERCLAAGANEYLSKPISLKILKEMIEKFL